MRATQNGLQPKASSVARWFEYKESPTCSKDTFRAALSLYIHLYKTNGI